MNRREAIKNTALFIGYAVSAGALTETFISCQNDSRTVSLDWKPEFLTTNQANTLAEMAETILPRTATPGAKDIGVPQFLDKVLKKLLNEAEQKDFVAGLEALEKMCKSAYGKYFDECTKEQREALLLKMDKEATKFPPNMWGITLVEKPEPITFYRRLKGLTLMAYFTSEKVAKDILVYDPIPGQYIGCMPQNGQNSWSE
ncbi:MAG: gluconate 2-dehydrogenase subunit 3 family protein [Saprospiraceae bacterium]|nr:gluconate 2-dehydrogenase subunit 3 family protein [Saprospiraceae bacterium]